MSASNPTQPSMVQHAQRTLRTAFYWMGGSVALAVYAGMSVHAPLSYTLGAAGLGVLWAALLVIHWRTRHWFWSMVAIGVLVLGLSLLRDAVFPGPGFLRGIHGCAVAVASGVLLLGVCRRWVAHFCRLDRDEPIDQPVTPARESRRE